MFEVVYDDPRCMNQVEEFVKASEIATDSCQCPDKWMDAPLSRSDEMRHAV